MPVARASDITKSLGPPINLVFLLPIMLIIMMMFVVLVLSQPIELVVIMLLTIGTREEVLYAQGTIENIMLR